ncbi:MAG: TIGR02147 family protein [Bacteriovoracia bacterium]
MKKAIFEYDSYKAYLSDWLESLPQAGRGQRSLMAKAMGCQTAYVSQVLKGVAHFSLEQADALAALLEQGKEERDFFFLLVQFERAGSGRLRSYFDEKIQELRRKRLMLKERLGVAQPLSESLQTKYFSSWHFAAVHVLATIPEFRTKDRMRRRLGLSQKLFNEAIDFLLQAGLLRQEGDLFFAGNTRIHLGNDAVMSLRHHTNWRLRSILALEKEEETDLHYSSVVTIAASDVVRIREILIQSIETVKPIVKESREEELYSFNLDFFRV